MATYNTVYNEALAYIQSVCTNVSNFGSLPAQFKSGYTYTESADTTHKNNKATVTYTISNPISEVTADTVAAEYASVMTSFGITASTSLESKESLLNFYRALAHFCAKNVRFCGSQLVSGKYVVYVPGAAASAVTKLANSDKITAQGGNAVLTIIDDMVAVGRPYFVRYNVVLATV